MSSPRAAAAKAARRAGSPVRAGAKPVAPGGDAPSASALALRLAGEIEHALADGRLDLLTPEAQQALMAALCKIYGAQADAGKPVTAFTAQSGVTPTDVMVTASALLRATDLAVFELGMWQSWTGR
jgi:hypothetical protein